MRTAGLRAGAGQALAAEGLHPDHGADHVAVDIDIADPDPGRDLAHDLRAICPELRIIFISG